MKVVAVARALLGGRSVGWRRHATAPTAGAGRDMPLAAGTIHAPRVKMQEADLARVTHVELLDAAGAPICKQASTWTGASFELDLGETETRAGKTVRFIDLDGNVVGELPFTAHAAPTLGAAS